MPYTPWQFEQKWQNLKKAFGAKCEKCGITEDKLRQQDQLYWMLEFAHTKPTKLSGMGRGKRHRYYDILNHPDSYMLLCHNHHREYDYLRAAIGEDVFAYRRNEAEKNRQRAERVKAFLERQL